MAESGVRTSVKILGAVFVVLAIVGVVATVKHPQSREPIRSPSVWYATGDGAWAQIPLDCDDDQHLVGVATTGERTIAVGWGDDAGSVWVSDDGTTWQRTWSDAAIEPHDVVAGGPGWVIVGGSWDGAILVSSDGLSWSRVLDAAGTALWTVETLDAALVAGGGSWADGGDVSATVWVSPDGDQWSSTSLPGGEGSQVIALTPFASGLLAAADSGAFWYSVDGKQWDAWQISGLDPMSVQDVAGKDWLLAVGWNWDGSPGMWKSADGHFWEEVPAPEDLSPFGAALHDGDVLALGQLSECTAAVLAVSEQGAVDVPQADDPMWSSDECQEEIPIGDGECDAGAARIYDVVVLDSGALVAVGYW